MIGPLFNQFEDVIYKNETWQADAELKGNHDIKDLPKTEELDNNEIILMLLDDVPLKDQIKNNIFLDVDTITLM